MLNALGKWIIGAADDPKRALILSGALNVALALLLVGGSFAQIEWVDGRPSVRPAARDVGSQVATLFAQPDRRAELRALLQEQGFYEISDAGTKDGRAVTRAIVALGETHDLVRELRELSRRNVHPFDVKERKVVIAPTGRKTVTEGEAAVCEKEEDLSQKWLLVWTDAGTGGFSVKVSESIECPPTDRQIVEVSPADWAKLNVDGPKRTDAVVKVYLHQPPEHVAGGHADVATSAPATTNM